uniref:ABC transporter domain-containing protein n=3 Tax=Photinus pyralis TaxID=7054 RepID=A0A1Y1KV25_PHOPY
MSNSFELTPVEKDVTQLAVCVRGGCKVYGRGVNAATVLKSIDLNVPTGAIYGLLGASGCGKTTLLSCIMGLKNLSSGDIWVLGGPPSLKNGNKIGYMPQQISLCEGFTIRESMTYFGWLAGLSSEKIEERAHFLMRLLDMPPIDSTIGNLSGGQQRRVSFATALLHEPELLILDEPTVGLDPILRESIWTYLLELTTNKSVTIILTTHYIDEAHRADVIGLMRNGVIISEEAPQQLLTKFRVNTLEEVFYRIIITKTEPSVTKRLRFPQTARETTTSNGPALNKHVLKALVWKNFLWMWKNIITIVSIFVLPIASVFVFGSCIGRSPTGLTVAIVNRETEVRTCDLLACHDKSLSCHFLRYLDRKALNLVYYDSEDEAIWAVRNGTLYASIVIKENYTESIEYRLRNRDVADFLIDQSTIDVFCDYTVKDIVMYLKKYIYTSFADFIGDYLEACEISRETVAVPLRFNGPIYGQSDPNMTDFANPGVILTLAFFMAAALTAGITLIERKEGVLERTMVMGVTNLEIAMGHFMCQFGLMLLQSMTPLLVLFYFFELTLNGSVANVITLTVFSGFCGMCAGLSISSNFEEERTAAYVLLGMFLPFVLLTGMLWPIEGMHPFLRFFTSFLPLTIPAESMRSVLQRGWGLSRPTVYNGLIVINVWALIFLGISYLGLKFRR